MSRHQGGARMSLCPSLPGDGDGCEEPSLLVRAPGREDVPAHTSPEREGPVPHAAVRHWEVRFWAWCTPRKTEMAGAWPTERRDLQASALRQEERHPRRASELRLHCPLPALLQITPSIPMYHPILRKQRGSHI